MFSKKPKQYLDKQKILKDVLDEYKNLEKKLSGSKFYITTSQEQLNIVSQQKTVLLFIIDIIQGHYDISKK